MGDDGEKPEQVTGELVPAHVDSRDRSLENLRPFPKGVSGNPGGKNAEREALRKWAMQTYTRKAIEGIAKLAGLLEDGGGGARSEFVRIDALKWLGDQGIGTAAAALRLQDADGNEVQAKVGIIILPSERSDDDGE